MKAWIESVAAARLTESAVPGAIPGDSAAGAMVARAIAPAPANAMAAARRDVVCVVKFPF